MKKWENKGRNGRQREPREGKGGDEGNGAERFKDSKQRQRTGKRQKETVFNREVNAEGQKKKKKKKLLTIWFGSSLIYQFGTTIDSSIYD